MVFGLKSEEKLTKIIATTWDCNSADECYSKLRMNMNLCTYYWYVGYGLQWRRLLYSIAGAKIVKIRK